MSSQPTLIAPTQTQQINRTLYVGKGYLTTIQSAVNFAATHDDQNFRIIIPAGYMGTETIASIVGGTPTITLVDERVGAAIFYQWVGYFTPVVSINGELTGNSLLNVQGFNFGLYGQPPAPTSGNGQSFDQQFISIAPSNGQDTTGTTGQTGGNGGLTVIWGGHGGQAPVGSTNGNGGNLDLFGGYAGRGAGTPGIPGDVHIQDSDANPAPVIFGDTYIGGSTPADATIIRHLGNLSAPNLDVGGTITAGDITAEGDINADNLILAGGVSADSAEFETALVNASPVRTFANTPDGPGQGMVWPEIGIPVSLGDHWQDPSIDPTTLAIYPAAGIAVSTGSAWSTPISPATLASWPPTGVPTSTGTAWGASLNPAALATYPAAGVAVSTGTAWAAPIAAATLARTNANNNFTASQSVTLNSLGSIPTPTQGLTLGWNVSNANGEAVFINSTPTGGGYSWYSVVGGTTVTPTTTKSMSLDTGNSLHVSGGIQALGPLTTPTVVTTSQVTIGTTGATIPMQQMVNGAAPANQKYWDWYVDGNGAYHGRMGNDALSALADWMTVTRSGNTPTAITLGANTAITGSLTATVMSIYNTTATSGPTLVSALPNMTVGATNTFFVGQSNTSNNMVYFGFSYGASAAANRGVVGWAGGNTAATFDVAGNWNFNGTITATSKNFRIIHPLDNTKHLNHSCPEGPESNVYYRGEGQTDGDGFATITLPDYFEALTLPDRRGVMLTEIFEEDDTELGKLSASRVKDGNFRVRSEFAAQKFYWQVWAIRADIPELQVVTDIPEPNPPEPTPEPEAEPSKKK